MHVSCHHTTLHLTYNYALHSILLIIALAFVSKYNVINYIKQEIACHREQIDIL